MKYIVSPHGLGVAIGIIGDKEQALYDAQLAENLYGINHSDALFDRLVFMDSWKQFKNFLVLKEYFKIRSDQRNNNILFPSELQTTKHAITLARKIIKENVSFENFMWQVAAAKSDVHECGIALANT